MLDDNLKFRKIRKGKLKPYKFNNLLFFGFVGLKSVESGFLNNNQLEIIKKILVSQTNKKLKIWLNIHYFIKLTRKALGTRMGKGKGKFNLIVSKIKAGTIFLEICGINKKKIIDILLKLKSKLPFKTKIIFFVLNFKFKSCFNITSNIKLKKKFNVTSSSKMFRCWYWYWKCFWFFIIIDVKESFIKR